MACAVLLSRKIMVFWCEKVLDKSVARFIVDCFRIARQIGIGAAVTRRPLPHHRAYGSVHGGSSWLR